MTAWRRRRELRRQIEAEIARVDALRGSRLDRLDRGVLVGAAS